MKKALSIIIVFITFIFIYLIQENFFSWFTIAGIKPNLFIIFSVFIGLFLGKVYGFTIGTIFGLLLDLILSKRIGINAISIGICGLLRRNIQQKLYNR